MEKDERIDRITEQILKFATSDFRARGVVSEKGDEIDAIVAGLNTLGEELIISLGEKKKNEERIDSLLELLLGYTVMDFSRKATISGDGDAIDAIAVGINSLSEELQIHMRKIREAQERIEAMIVNAPEAVIVIDYKNLIADWNPKAELLFNWKKQEVIGKELEEIIIPPDSDEVSIREFKNYLRTENATVSNMQFEFSALRKDNSEFDIGVSISPFNYNEKKYFIVFISDITVRKRAEEELKAVNNELDAFTYSVSHDLRTPLRSINSYSQVLLEDHGGKLDDDGIRTLNVIKRNAVKMGRLIDDLLAFSHLGKQNPKKVNLNMKAIINNVIAELKNHQASESVEFDIQPLIELKGDLSMLKQVMTNIISNALKYSSKKDKAKIQITSYADDDNVIYSVKDNGAGFDMQYYDKLFGVFQRLHSTNEFEGTGVGLALVHRIITKHGGKVWAEGKVGEGATFYFSLPKN